MPSINTVTLMGHLGNDSETKKFENGEIATFSLATSKQWKDKATGEKKTKTQWHKVVIKNPHLIKFSMLLGKGDLVYLEGGIEYREYTNKEGNKVSITEIVVGYNGRILGMSNKESNE